MLKLSGLQLNLAESFLESGVQLRNECLFAASLQIVDVRRQDANKFAVFVPKPAA